MATFEVFVAEAATLGNAIGFPGFPCSVSGLREIIINDDDDALDFSGDDGQTVVSQAGSDDAAIERLELIEIAPVGGGPAQTFVALFPAGPEAFLIPLNDAGTVLQSVQAGGDPTGQSFTATLVTDQPDPVAYCFAGDTLIATPHGEVMVKDLAIGDEVVTFGGTVVPIEWIGRQTVDLRLGPPERLLPVKIRRGALGENVPSQDLVLTRDHAVFVGGILANAGALVNGTSIVSVPRQDLGPVVTYYHIDTCRHDLVLANNTPAETLIDQPGARAHFDNYDDYVALFGDRSLDTPELFYPRAMSRRQLPAGVRALLSAHAATLPVSGRRAA